MLSYAILCHPMPCNCSACPPVTPRSPGQSEIGHGKTNQVTEPPLFSTEASTDLTPNLKHLTTYHNHMCQSVRRSTGYEQRPSALAWERSHIVIIPWLSAGPTSERHSCRVPKTPLSPHTSTTHYSPTSTILPSILTTGYWRLVTAYPTRLVKDKISVIYLAYWKIGFRQHIHASDRSLVLPLVSLIVRP